MIEAQLLFLKLLEERARLCYFYVYMYRHPVTYEPFYIGKGYTDNGYDRKRYHLRCALDIRIDTRDCNNPRFIRRIRKIIREGFEPEIIFIKQGMSNKDSLILERKLIKDIGRIDQDRGPLLNMTDGGDGVSPGRKGPRPASVRKKLSIKLLAFYQTLEGQEVARLRGELISGDNNPGKGKPAWNRGNGDYWTPEMRIQQSVTLRAFYNTPEGIALAEEASIRGTGKVASEETLARLSVSINAFNATPEGQESIRKNAEARIGRPVSEITCAKISAGNKAFYATPEGKLVAEEASRRNTGKKSSPEAIEANRQAHLGIIQTEETKRKKSESHRRHMDSPKGEITREKCRANARRRWNKVKEDKDKGIYKGRPKTCCCSKCVWWNKVAKGYTKTCAEMGYLAEDRCKGFLSTTEEEEGKV